MLHFSKAYFVRIRKPVNPRKHSVTPEKEKHSPDKHPHHHHRLQPDQTTQKKGADSHLIPTIVVSITDHKARKHKEKINGQITMIDHLIQVTGRMSFEFNLLFSAGLRNRRSRSVFVSVKSPMPFNNFSYYIRKPYRFLPARFYPRGPEYHRNLSIFQAPYRPNLLFLHIRAIARSHRFSRLPALP